MFKPIKNHEKYLINENGVIIDEHENCVRINQNLDGYLYAYIDNEKVFIHEMVAELFKPIKFIGDDFVIHKDNDMLHNHVTNLEWSSEKEEVEDYFVRKKYSKGNHLTKTNVRPNKYMVYNEEKNDFIICESRIEVADLIQYELISLKNMVGNNRLISLGPYKGYKIDRLRK